MTTYGMTETAGGCVYDGHPLDGVTVRIGEGVELAGPTLALGYRLDPPATAASFVDGWFRTRDAGSLDDGRLTVHGRLDDVVINGEANVAPAAVEAALREHPDVADAVVFGHPDPEWGQRVVAAVVPAPAQHPRWRPCPWVADRLGVPAAPRTLQVVDGFRCCTPAKPDRRALAEAVRPRWPPPPSGWPAPARRPCPRPSHPSSSAPARRSRSRLPSPARAPGARRRTRPAGGQLRQRLLRRPARHRRRPGGPGPRSSAPAPRRPPGAGGGGAGVRGRRRRRRGSRGACRAGGWSPSAPSASRPRGRTPAALPTGTRPWARSSSSCSSGWSPSWAPRRATLTLPGLAFAVAVPVGLLSTALLVVNNLRGIEGDALVGKRTLAVLLGARGTRLAYVGLLAGAFAVIAGVGISAWVLIALLAGPRGPPARTV